jgi:trk system potassium uptake protein
MISYRKLLYSTPGLIIFTSLCMVIFLGSILLWLPIAHVQPVAYLDALFTATSATCVTGLFTIPLDVFSPFGHFIIMILMQIGGLGLITMTLMFLSLFVAKFGLSTQLMVGHLLDLESWQNIKTLLLFIAFITFTSELIGALCITVLLAHHEPLATASFYALFHAIAAFCNAGIELPHMYYAQLYKTNYFVLTITMLLSLIGGLGFVTWYEIASWVKAKYEGKLFRFSLHSKIIFYGITFLLISSATIIWLLERHHAFAAMNLPHSIVYSLFEAITNKSAGFSLIPLTLFKPATVLVIMILAFIGSSPASTGSGIKITTCALLLATVKTAFTDKTMVEIKGRRIAKDQVFKSVAICFIGLSCITLVTFVLLILEPGQSFFSILFESWSALTNLGSTLGATMRLSMWSKLVIMLSMLIGRVGSFTLILSLKMIRRKDTNEFIYPEERVML